MQYRRENISYCTFRWCVRGVSISRNTLALFCVVMSKYRSQSQSQSDDTMHADQGNNNNNNNTGNNALLKESWSIC